MNFSMFFMMFITIVYYDFKIFESLFFQYLSTNTTILIIIIVTNIHLNKIIIISEKLRYFHLEISNNLKLQKP